MQKRKTVWSSAAVRAAMATALLAFASASGAQQYPVKPIRFVLGFPPGTILDAVARPVGNEMEKQLGQPIVIDFKPGANGTIGAKSVVEAAPDGYTLYYGNVITIHPLLTANNSVDAARDLASVSRFVSTPFSIIASAKLPATSLSELVSYAKARTEPLKHGSNSVIADLIMEMFKARTGISYRSIPYKASSQTVLAILSGEVDITNGSVVAYLPHIKSGQARVLFIAADKRAAQIPDVPTAAEVGLPNFELGFNYGLWAPAKTPRDIIQKLSSAVAVAMKVPSIAGNIRDRFISEPIGSTPEEQLRTFDAEIKFWAEAARLANFKAQ